MVILRKYMNIRGREDLLIHDCIVCLNFYSGNLSRFQYFDRKGNTHQGQFSKIRTPQITLAFHWPAKINKMLMQRRRLLGIRDWLI
jgi:hypothetical protein